MSTVKKYRGLAATVAFLAFAVSSLSCAQASARSSSAAPYPLFKLDGIYKEVGGSGMRIGMDGVPYNDADALNIVMNHQDIRATRRAGTKASFVYIHGRCVATFTPYRQAGKQMMHVEEVPLATCTGADKYLEKFSADFVKLTGKAAEHPLPQ